jgi:hypothetical protein
MDASVTVQRLIDGAQSFAWSAMDAHAENQEEVFLLHAGVSVERLAKAVLATKSVFLLLDLRGNEESLLHLAGVQETTRVRTIGAAQAIARLGKMGVLPTRDDELNQLIDLRNGVAHLAGSSTGEDFDGLKVFARTTNALLPHLKIAVGDYWDRFAEVARVVLSEAAVAAERDLARRLAQARYRLDRRLRALPEEAASAYVASRSQVIANVNTRSMYVQINMPRECPACGNTGTITTGAPVLVRRGHPGKGQPFAFNCDVCGLQLWTRDLLVAAAMGDVVPLLDETGQPLLDFEEEARLFGHQADVLRQLEESGHTTP